MSDKLIAVRRQLLPLEHSALREYIPHINRECGDVSIKWFHLGTAACTLIERGEYKKVQEKEQGQLKHKDANQVANAMRTAIADMPTEARRLTADIVDVDFFGHGTFWQIAYALKSPELQQERERLTDYIDQQNRITGHWGKFALRVAVATIPSTNATDDVLDSFWQIAPETMTLEPAWPIVS